MLTWCISNVVAARDPAGNAKLDKVKSNGRIDAAVALAVALYVAGKHVGEPEWSPRVELI